MIRPIRRLAAVIGAATLSVAGAQTVPDGQVFAFQPLLTRTPLAEGVSNPSASRSGRRVVFHTGSAELEAADGNGVDDVYLLQRDSGVFRRVSIAMGGGDPNGSSVNAAISADGSWVSFHSSATNLVADDTNGALDVFVADLASGLIQKVSIGMGGVPANGGSINSAISADGRYVAFSSFASNLVADDLNDQPDVFVHDRQTGDTRRVSVSTDGEEADAGSFVPFISANGRYVAFHSEATNFSDNEFDELPDVFLHDRATGQTSLVNISTEGTRSNSDSARAVLSPDARYVTFYSRATTLEPVPELFNIHFDMFLRDTLTEQTELVSRADELTPTDGDSFNGSVSENGRVVVFDSIASNLIPQESPRLFHVYAFDRDTRQTQLLSATEDRLPGNGTSTTPAITGDGGEVFFVSQANNFDPLTSTAPQLFVRDRKAPGVARLSLRPEAAAPPAVVQFSMSGDARFVVFASDESGLVPDDGNGARDVFLYDRFFQRLSLISGDPAGLPVSGLDSDSPVVTGDGCGVAFVSLTPGPLLGADGPADLNGSADVFYRDCALGELDVLTLAVDGAGYADTGSGPPSVSDNGGVVAFASAAGNLEPDGNPAGVSQVYLVDRASGQRQPISTRPQGTLATGSSDSPVVSADGEYVAFVSRDSQLDGNLDPVLRPSMGTAGVYRYQRTTGEVELISLGTDGAGGLVAPDGDSLQPSISTDGSVIAFASHATNLTGQPAVAVRQVYVWQEQGGANGITAMVPGAVALTGTSEHPVISRDGRVLVFQSDAPEWAGDDLNGETDLVVYDLRANQWFLASRDLAGGAAGSGGGRPALAGEGGQQLVGFVSSTNLTGEARAGGLYLQGLRDARPRLRLEGFTESPLQSVERGSFRLNLRNTGLVPVSADQGIRLRFPGAVHPLEFNAPPRWSCRLSPELECDFSGDALGDVIYPGGGERLDLEFRVFPGDTAFSSTAAIDADFGFSSDQPQVTLTTERVVRGLAWEATVPDLVPLGGSADLQVTVTNGGIEPLQQVELRLFTGVPGNGRHDLELGVIGDWECEETEQDGRLETVCRYQGPSLNQTEQTVLRRSFLMDRGRLDTAVVAAGAVEDVLPPGVVVVTTRASELVFADGFE